MNKNILDLQTLNAILTCLDDESIEEINFDDLRNVLDKTGAVGDECTRLASELNLIKEEYRNRVVGILRANMACRPNDDDAALVHRLNDNLETVPVSELIKLYSRSAARFRDNFPSSFKYLGFARRAGSIENWMDHKI
nr:hypothetical protein [candidate division Zixibacteria bacterium]